MFCSNTANIALHWVPDLAAPSCSSYCTSTNCTSTDWQLHLHRAAAPSKILPPQLPKNPPLAPCLHPNAPLTQPLQHQFLILTSTPLMPVDTHQLDAKAFPNAASDAHHSLRNQSTFDINLSKKVKKSVFNVCIRIYPQQIW